MDIYLTSIMNLVQVEIQTTAGNHIEMRNISHDMLLIDEKV